jgi:paraquat-inducible protein B
VRVGRVVGYGLSPDGRALDVQVFVESPYENIVTRDTRFWHASGVDLSVNASGVTLNTQSLLSVFAGAIAFATPDNGGPSPPAESGQAFRLFDQRRAALAPDSGEPVRVRMVFAHSLRGLEQGAPIELMGVEIGSVHSVTLQPGRSMQALPVEVLADLYPQRLGAARERFFAPGAPRDDRLLLKQLVEHGLRAQARTANLLTGAMYVALEFVPNPKRVAFDASAPVPTLPTVPGALADVQPQLADIVARLSRVRFDEIGTELQAALKALNRATLSLQGTLVSADTSIKQLTPEAQAAIADLRQALTQANQTLASAQATLRSAEANVTDARAPLQRNANQALAELQRAAQALRVLADYLQRHPESILRGKPDMPLPPPAEKQ